MIHTQVFIRILIWTNGFVIKASSSVSGHMALIPGGCWNSAALCHLHCTEPRPRCFYIAALWSFSLPEFLFSPDLASGDLLLTEFWIFTWTSIFHSFRVFEVGQGARSRLHMLACCIDGNNSNCTASEFFDWPSFILELPKTLKKRRPA